MDNRNGNTTYAPLISRILISILFLSSGLGKIAAPKATEAYMASVHMPLVPLMLAGAIAVEVLGSIALILGFQTRIVAAIMALYLIPATLLFHNFWAVEGMARQMQEINFWKNVAIIGGLGMVVAYGAGQLSLDARLPRRKVRVSREPVTAA